MRPLILYADGPGAPRSSPDVVLAAAGLSGDPEVLLGWTLEEHAWLSSPTLSGRTAMGGYALGRAIAAGRITVVSCRLSGVPALVAHARPDVCVVTGVRRGGELVFGSAVAWAPAATRIAGCVVIEIDEDGFDFGGPVISGNIVATIPRPAGVAGTDVTARTADDIDLAIGAAVVSLLPESPTLQFGPGGIGEGICRALDRPVAIFSGLVTDAMADLDPRGLLVGPIIGGYVWGGEPVRDLFRVGRLRLEPIELTHDLTRMSETPGFVGCNTALQVDLDGSVNIEQVGGRLITSIGGHPDYCAAAVRSIGGLSIIALRSTNRRGESSIVPRVEVVSTPRSDVSAVVTEHGIADLRGAGQVERARRIIEVAAPEHRDELAAAMVGRSG